MGTITDPDASFWLKFILVNSEETSCERADFRRCLSPCSSVGGPHLDTVSSIFYCWTALEVWAAWVLVAPLLCLFSFLYFHQLGHWKSSDFPGSLVQDRTWTHVVAVPVVAYMTLRDWIACSFLLNRFLFQCSRDLITLSGWIFRETFFSRFASCSNVSVRISHGGQFVVNLNYILPGRLRGWAVTFPLLSLIFLWIYLS